MRRLWRSLLLRPLLKPDGQSLFEMRMPVDAHGLKRDVVGPQIAFFKYAEGTTQTLRHGAHARMHRPAIAEQQHRVNPVPDDEGLQNLGPLCQLPLKRMGLAGIEQPIPCIEVELENSRPHRAQVLGQVPEKRPYRAL